MKTRTPFQRAQWDRQVEASVKPRSRFGWICALIILAAAVVAAALVGLLS